MAAFFSGAQAGEKLLDAFPSAATLVELKDDKLDDRPKTKTKTKTSKAPANGKTAKNATKEVKLNKEQRESAQTTTPTIAAGKVGPEWGRFNGGTWLGALGCGGIILICPVLVILLQIALFYFNGSILNVFLSLYELGPVEFTVRYAPRYSQTATLGYVAWLLFQGFLYMCLPSKICYGQQTPAGHLLPYHINGLYAWAVTHIAYFAGSYFGLLDPAIIAKNWEGLIIAFNMYGYILPLIAYIKAHLAPTHKDDIKFSGSMIYDYYMGIEFNPRIGAWFDFKLFHNGRPGIVMWTLM